MTSPGRCLVIGCGSMGRRRLRHVQAAGASAMAVYDVRDDRMAEAAEIADVLRIGGMEALAEFRPNAAFICVPPADHEEYIAWAVENRVHFMVEQPISHRLGNLDDILSDVESAGLIVHVSNNHLFSAETAAIKNLIDGGTLGRPLTAIVERGEWLPNWHTYEPYMDYYPSSRAMGGGLDAICDFAWLRHLFGEIEDAKSLTGKHSDLNIDTFDVTQFLFRFQSGVQVAMHIDMLQKPYAASTKIVFEEGTLIHNVPDTFLRVFEDRSGSWREAPFDEDSDAYASMQGKPDFNFVEPMYERDTGNFLDRLAAGEKTTDSLRDGIENLRVIHSLVEGV